MKKLIFFSLFFYSVSMSAQEKISCEDFLCVTEKIENFIQNAEYESALKILLAADAFDDHDKEKIDDMFQNLFDAIQQERDKAVQMADELTISLERQETLQKKIADDKEGRIISMTDDLLSKVRNERKSKRYEIALLNNKAAEQLIIDSIGDYSNNISLSTRMSLISDNRLNLEKLTQKKNLYESYISEAKKMRAKGIRNYSLVLDNLISADSLNIAGMEAHNMIEEIDIEMQDKKFTKDLSNEEHGEIMARIYYYKRDVNGVKSLARKSRGMTFFEDNSSELTKVFRKAKRTFFLRSFELEYAWVGHQSRQTLWNKNYLSISKIDSLKSASMTIGGSLGINFTAPSEDIFSANFRWFNDVQIDNDANENDISYGNVSSYEYSTEKQKLEWSNYFVNEFSVGYRRKLFNRNKASNISLYSILDLGVTFNQYGKTLINTRTLLEEQPNFLNGFSALVRARNESVSFRTNYSDKTNLSFSPWDNSDLASLYACRNYIITTTELFNDYHISIGGSFRWRLTKKPVITFLADLRYRLPTLNFKESNQVNIGEVLLDNVRSQNILGESQLLELSEYYSRNCNHDISVGLQKENITYDRLNLTVGFAFRLP